MSSFKCRSYQKELLDGPAIPFEDIKRNMQELDLINRRLGGHAITLKGISGLLPLARSSDFPLHIAEIGCGGGDNLKAIQSWASTKGIEVRLTGIDINRECIAYASEQSTGAGISFIHSDYRDVTWEKKPHIIFSSLFCHHFTDQELVDMLQWMRCGSRLGFFINDLHRHPLAYYSIKCLTRLFSRSYLVKNDAPLSVKRGFKRQEWKHLFEQAGMANFVCEWQWAFRWLITYHN